MTDRTDGHDKTVQMIIENMDVDCMKCTTPNTMKHMGDGVFRCLGCRNKIAIYPGVIK
jgi:ribosomal protein L37AE/L43A